MTSKRPGSRENIRVICRIRPTNQKEIASNGVVCLKHTDKALEVETDDGSAKFSFDRIFGPDSTQIEVFDNAAVPLVNDVLSGYNATIFAYGQTGTGKTHTMEGNIHSPDLKGIIPRSVEALFNGVLEADENIEFAFKVSYVEIYMEKIRDLLDENRLKTNLTVREDKIKGIYIAGVTEVYVTSHSALLDIMAAGASNRAVAATGMNEGSSRSHSVFTITVTKRNLLNNTTTSGKLVLVDLAGSEMVRKSNASGQQLEEAKTINKSLSALGQVINALTAEKQTHVPYRDSKLTRILQDSLGGNAKTVLIIAVSPSSYNASETISTLRFGTRAKSIENKVTVNQTRSVEELENLLIRAEKAIDIQSTHIASLMVQIEALQSGGGGQGSNTGGNSSSDPALLAATKASEAKIKEYELLTQALQDNITAITNELDEEKLETIRKDSEIIELTKLLREKDQTQMLEANEVILELQKQYNIQKDINDSLMRERDATITELDTIKTQLETEIDKLNFEKREYEVSIDTLRSENRQLQLEIDEMSGDGPGNNKPIKSQLQVQPQSQINEGRNSPIVADSASGTKPLSQMLQLTDNHSNPSTTASANSSTPNWFSTISAELDAQFQVELSSTAQQHSLSQESIAALNELLTRFVRIHRERLAALYEEKSARDRVTGVAEQGRKWQDLITQRTRLEKDLAEQINKVNQLQFSLDLIRGMEAPVRSGDEAALGKDEVLNEIKNFITAREKAIMRSLQQRLEQLVVVHRQLLRKYASVELEVSESKKKLTLRDERIKQLEAGGRTLMGSMKQQGERHVADLTALREQLNLVRLEHNLRIENSSKETHMITGSNTSREVRTLRGGQLNTTLGIGADNTGNTMNVIRGKGKTGIASSSGAVSINSMTPGFLSATKVSSAFADPLNMNSNSGGTGEVEGASVPTSKSIFSRLLGTQM